MPRRAAATLAGFAVICTLNSARPHGRSRQPLETIQIRPDVHVIFGAGCGWIEAQGRPESAPNLVCRTDGSEAPSK